jgi:hypothetical protein
MLPESNRYFLSLVGGLLGVAIFMLLAFVVIWSTAGTKNAHQRQRGWQILIEGADGRLSASKAQWAAWTALVAGTYVAIYVARVLSHVPDPVTATFPSNLLLAMGFSTATMVTAKGITSTYVAGGRLPSKTSGVTTSGGLLTDDDGITDLSKVQLLTWTAIAISVYVYTVINQLRLIIHDGKDVSIPDIDGALMVLMGLSQGGYLGKKLTSAPPVTVSALVPSTAKAGVDLVRVYGSNFGDAAPDGNASPDSNVLVGGAPAVVANGGWSDTKITFTVPAAAPNGPWTSGQGVPVQVVANGQVSDNAPSLTIV